ncbi:restriction endonuclease [Streptomyces sp. NPDC000229]|uniref:restriction endonuclease n=1 Tax=Streptomyces sp. NPDC000229 TaxID=3154247 RepID=UPI00332FCFA7
MTGTEFEDLVASLCRRDGCTDVRRVGGANDNGADVVGRLPDGRSVVIQCKRYAPTSTIASRELRDLLGAKVHFGADLAVFVTTTRFSRPSERFALQHGILAVHRAHFGAVEQRGFTTVPERGERPRAGRLPPPSSLEAGV